MNSGFPKLLWAQNKVLLWGVGVFSVLVIGSGFAGMILQWPWSDGSDWQAIWAYCTFIVAGMTAFFALAQLSAHHEAQREQSRPYVIVDFAFRSTLLSFEVKNIGQTPSKDISLAWDLNPRSTDKDRDQVLKRNLVEAKIPFLAPGRAIRYFIDIASVYWNDESMPKRFEVVASYVDARANPFGAGEELILDFSQWADALVDTDYDNKNWNELKRQAESQKKMVDNLVNVGKQLNSIRELVTVLGPQLASLRNSEVGSRGVKWVIVPGEAMSRRLINVGTVTAERTRVTDVTNEEGRSGFSLTEKGLPRDVVVKDFIAASMGKSLADPHTSRILIKWEEGDDIHEQTCNIG
jgi:hypothetical protein